MEGFARDVSSLITDFWQRYPAGHDIRLAIDGRVVSVYANSRLVLDGLRLRHSNAVTPVRPDVLLAVIQDPEMSPVAVFPDGRSSFSLTLPDGRVEWIASKGLLLLLNRGRYMIGGNCLGHMDEVARFITTVAADDCPAAWDDHAEIEYLSENDLVY